MVINIQCIIFVHINILMTFCITDLSTSTFADFIFNLLFKTRSLN